MRPHYFDNVKRQPQTKGTIKYKTQDPLFFDYDHKYLNGGIEVVIINA